MPAVNTRQSTVNESVCLVGKTKSGCGGCSVGITTGAAGGFSPRPSNCAPADTGPANKIKTINAGNRSSFSKRRHSHEFKFVGGFRPSPHAFSADPSPPRGDREKAGPPAPDKSRRHPLKHCTRGDDATDHQKTCPRWRSHWPETPPALAVAAAAAPWQHTRRNRQSVRAD